MASQLNKCKCCPPKEPCNPCRCVSQCTRNYVKCMVREAVDVDKITQEVINKLDYDMIVTKVIEKIDFTPKVYAAETRENRASEVIGIGYAMPIEHDLINTLGVDKIGDHRIVIKEAGIYKVMITVNTNDPAEPPTPASGLMHLMLYKGGYTPRTYELTRVYSGFHGEFVIPILENTDLTTICNAVIRLTDRRFPIVNFKVELLKKGVDTTEFIANVVTKSEPKLIDFSKVDVSVDITATSEEVGKENLTTETAKKRNKKEKTE